MCGLSKLNSITKPTSIVYTARWH